MDTFIEFTEVSDAINYVQVGLDYPPYQLWSMDVKPMRLGTTKAYDANDYSILKI